MGIQKIEITALWQGHKHIVWELNPDVNILSGVNGVGKSTILNRVIRHLHQSKIAESEDDGVILTFSEGTTSLKYDVIRSFDRPVLSTEVLGRIVDVNLTSELDFVLYQLQRRYLDYQVNLSHRLVQLFTSQDPQAQEKAQEIAREKNRFLDLVDSLLSETGKKVIRDRNEIILEQWGEELSPYKLSSGEKQMLIILLTVLVENQEPYTLFMDEPEISLHIEWQQRLITMIRGLNPNAQIIMTTHSPAVIMDGWADSVTDVEDISH